MLAIDTRPRTNAALSQQLLPKSRNRPASQTNRPPFDSGALYQLNRVSALKLQQ